MHPHSQTKVCPVDLCKSDRFLDVSFELPLIVKSICADRDYSRWYFIVKL
jgi:hypothetical protein